MITKTDFLQYLDTPAHFWASRHGQIEMAPSPIEQHRMGQGQAIEGLAREYIQEHLLQVTDAELIHKKTFIDGNFQARVDTAAYYPAEEVILGESLGVPKYKSPPIKYQGMERGRLPDFITSDYIADAKWYSAKRLSMSGQLRDFLIISQVEGKPLWLYVRQSTTVSKTVLAELQLTGGGIVRFFP